MTCGSHFVHSHSPGPPDSTASPTSSGACSTASWQSNARASAAVRSGGPSTLSTPQPARSTTAGWSPICPSRLTSR
ncbi:hypothetical protein [Plantactinospora sp. KBS50]|uniref:hypothetical protein n=1 Tax=Plantactinospora sp. KBS50 TaxID=2024580 RepID=UPI0018E0600B|nr:hypothetical protein [Plantactinospora sp. KBS50]